MLAESLEYLAVKPDGRYLDCTAGLAGHTKAIAALLTQGGQLIANDRDAQSLEMARTNAAEFADRIEFQHGSFSELAERNLDGLIADLGVSRFQLTDPGTRIFISGRRAFGYAPRPESGRDRGRTAEPQCRKGNRRLASPARRRKESAEDSRSNRSGAAHSEHTAPGGCSGTGRAANGTLASRDSHFHGFEDGGQSRAGRARRVAEGARRAW